MTMSARGWFGAILIVMFAALSPTLEAQPSVCDTGNDPGSGESWVVCQADADNAWVSHNNAEGGDYHPELICQQLGYGGFDEFGGTCGNVCGYCEESTSCSDPGDQVFDGQGDCGTDGLGQVLCDTVTWQCVGQIATAPEIPTLDGKGLLAMTLALLLGVGVAFRRLRQRPLS